MLGTATESQRYDTDHYPNAQTVTREQAVERAEEYMRTHDDDAAEIMRWLLITGSTAVAERTEACAKIADEVGRFDCTTDGAIAAGRVADRIRAMKE